MCLLLRLTSLFYWDGSSCWQTTCPQKANFASNFRYVFSLNFTDSPISTFCAKISTKDIADCPANHYFYEFSDRVLNLRYVSGPATINNDGKICLAKKFSRGEFLKEQQSGSVAMKNELRVCETFECVYRLSFCFLLLIETNYRLCCSPFVSL